MRSSVVRLCKNSFPTRRSSDLRVDLHEQRDERDEQQHRAAELVHQDELSRTMRSEEHTSELQSPYELVCRLLLEKKRSKNKNRIGHLHAADYQSHEDGKCGQVAPRAGGHLADSALCGQAS